MRLRDLIAPLFGVLGLLAVASVALTARADELLSYQAANWKYSAASSSDAPITSLFYAPTYDVSGWATGQAAFGSGGSCPLQANVHTAWPVGTTLMVRHMFSAQAHQPVTVYFEIDNDAKVYVNGVQIANVVHEGCPLVDEYSVAVSGDLIDGCDNSVAACVTDRGGESFFDLRIEGLMCVTPVSPSTWGRIKSLYH
jgi:hypothetical protein